MFLFFTFHHLPPPPSAHNPEPTDKIGDHREDEGGRFQHPPQPPTGPSICVHPHTGKNPSCCCWWWEREQQTDRMAPSSMKPNTKVRIFEPRSDTIELSRRDPDSTRSDQRSKASVKTETWQTKRTLNQSGAAGLPFPHFYPLITAGSIYKSHKFSLPHRERAKLPGNFWNWGVFKPHWSGLVLLCRKRRSYCSLHCCGSARAAHRSLEDHTAQRSSPPSAGHQAVALTFDLRQLAANKNALALVLASLRRFENMNRWHEQVVTYSSRLCKSAFNVCKQTPWRRSRLAWTLSKMSTCSRSSPKV